MTRACLIGLDCLSPHLVFSKLQGELPNLTRLAAAGVAGPIASTIPAISIPAWTVLATGVDPGTLGVYGFHDRLDHGYLTSRLSSSQHYDVPPLWTVLGRSGLSSRVAYVPQTFPAKPFQGVLIAGIPTPASLQPHTYPPELAAELRGRWGSLDLDVAEFRRQDREQLWRKIFALTERHFALARSWIKEPDWDFFMMVELGADRIQHGYWQYFDPRHPRYVQHPDFSGVIAEYYRLLDREVGKLIADLRPDDVVIIVSDHGAQCCLGGIAINDFLMQHGYLRLKRKPRGVEPLRVEDVDWPKTRAWAAGGHVGRVYLNISGREPLGVVALHQAPALLAALTEDLGALLGPAGECMKTKVYQPVRIYRRVRGVAPDLIVYFDDLTYRAVGSVGHASLFVSEEEIDFDGASHSREGIFILGDGRGARRPPLELSLLDVAPTICDRLNVPIPPYMLGNPERGNNHETTSCVLEEPGRFCSWHRRRGSGARGAGGEAQSGSHLR
jgi:predicted AlkP superfamily phosphohydrolase/phosphomutase